MYFLAGYCTIVYISLILACIAFKDSYRYSESYCFPLASYTNPIFQLAINKFNSKMAEESHSTIVLRLVKKNLEAWFMTLTQQS